VVVLKTRPPQHGYFEETEILEDSAGAAFQVHTDELQRGLERRDAKHEQLEATLRGRITELEEKLSERNIERDQMQQKLEETDHQRKFVEAILCDQIHSLGFNILILENKLKKEKMSRNQVEAHFCEMKQMDTTILGQITVLEKILEEKDSERARVEMTLRSQIDEMERKMEERQAHCNEVEIILYGQREELERELLEKKSIHHEENHDWKIIEEALHCKIKQLKRIISDMESNRQKLEYTVPCHIKEQKFVLRQTERDEHVEATLHGQMGDLQDDDCGLREEMERRTEEAEAHSKDI
jgi:hypothetical protein